MLLDGKDEKTLKVLGELLSNDTSRTMIILLKEREMYKQQIAKEIGIGVSTVIHHISKMEEIGLVTISQKKIIRKGIEHNFYRIDPQILIDITRVEPDKRNLRRNLKDSWKFIVAGAAAIASYLLGISRIESTDALISGEPTIPANLVIHLLVIVIIGLVVYVTYQKKKK